MNRTEHGEDGWLQDSYAGRRGRSPGKIDERGVFLLYAHPHAPKIINP